MISCSVQCMFRSKWNVNAVLRWTIVDEIFISENGNKKQKNNNEMTVSVVVTDWMKFKLI